MYTKPGMKIAVTGASGYLGGLILRRLDGDPSVGAILGLDIAMPRFESDKFTFRRADVRSADFAAELRGVDAVYHLAYIVQPPKKSPMSVVDEINVAGSRRVFEGAAAAGVPKMICASSVSIYGIHADNPAGITEDFSPRPNPGWYYSRTKAKMEASLDEIQGAHAEMVIIRMRPCAFFGPGVENSMGDMFSAGVLISLGRYVKIDFCWDEDVADAFILALRHGESDVFNLAGENPLTVEEMGRISGKKVLQVNHKLAIALIDAAHSLGLCSDGDAEWVRMAGMGSLTVSSEKARKVLGWNPRFDAAGAFLEFLKYRGRTRFMKTRANAWLDGTKSGRS